MTSQQDANTIPAYLKAAPDKPVNSDKLAQLQDLAVSARDTELRIANLQDQLRAAGSELREIYYDKMPALMQELGLDKLGLPPDGNQPGVNYSLKTYYSANIAAGWPPEKREQAFKFMARYKADDLIKTEVTVLFPRGGLKAAQKLLAQVKKIKIPSKQGKKKVKLSVRAELTKTIPHNTLGAWLRELAEKHGRILPPADLEIIGGSIGKFVKPETRSE